jgi:DeoR/GlpR family transcriptional regulator of sugar metabolism
VQQTEALPEERQRMIADRLAREGRVVALELARQFGTSEDTIRRDLRELAAAGLCRRVYGGALPLSPASASLAERLAVVSERKQALGATLAGLLPTGQVLFVDAGSTHLVIHNANRIMRQCHTGKMVNFQ